MTEHKKAIRNILMGIVTILILIPCSLFLFEVIKSSGAEKVEFYYMMNDGRLKPVDGWIETRTQGEMLEDMLSALKEPPKIEGASAVIPQDLEFLAVKLKNNTAVVDISSSYFRMKDIEEVICRSSLVWTLTSLDFVENVEIYVGGRPLLTGTGAVCGPMNRSSVVIDAEIAAETTEYAILKLYFSNAEGTDLEVEERVIEVNTNQSREKSILEQLIAGPLENCCSRTIPAETKIRDVTTTNDGTCYVNLSQEFVTKRIGGEKGELLAVYSIVNSLCELEQVEKVQFLIEGEKLDDFNGQLDFKTPFTAINSLKTAETK